MQKKALVAAGVIFALLTVSHFIRWFYSVEVLVDGENLPVVVSLFASIFFALLTVWMLIVVKKL